MPHEGHLDPQAYIAVLEGRVEQLEHRIRELTAMLTEPALAQPWPEEWQLTKTESLFLLTLRSGELVSRQDILRGMYPDRVALPDPKLLDVMACKLRKRLAPFGKTIENVWGRGLRLADIRVPATNEVTQ